MKGNVLVMLGLLIGIGLLWHACIIAVVDYSETGAAPKFREFREATAFPPGGTISLRNFDGNIEVIGWDNDEVEVYAEIMIPRPIRPGVQVLSWNRAFPRVDFDKSDDRIMLRTRAPDRDGKDCVVDYYVHVPHSIRLKNIVAREGDVVVADLYGEIFIELQTGDIQVENFSGSIVSSVVQGSIRATLYDLRETDEIKMRTKNGDIIIHLQPGVNARIQGSFPDGQFFSDFDVQIPEGDRDILLELGKEKGASIHLETLKGDIQVKNLDSQSGF